MGSASSAVATINSAPNAPLASGGESCGPGPVPLKATGSGGILKWYLDAGLTVQVGSGSSFTTPSLSGTTTYYVTETSAAGCASSASSAVATVRALPVAEIQPLGPTTFCAGGGVTLDAGRGFTRYLSERR